MQRYNTNSYTLEQIADRLDFVKDCISERVNSNLPTCVVCQQKIKSQWRWIYIPSVDNVDDFTKCVCWGCKEHYE